MADFILSAEITANASSLEREAKKAEQALSSLEKKTESTAQKAAAALAEAFNVDASGVKKAADETKAAVTDASAVAEDAAKAVAQETESAAEKAASEAQSAAADVAAAADNAEREAKGAAHNAAAEAKAAADESSTALVAAAQESENAANEAAAGAETAVNDVAGKSESAAQRIASSFSSAFSGIGSGMQNGLSGAGQFLTDTGKKFESAGAQMTASGKAMSMGLTAPLTAMYKASDAAFKEVDAGMDIVVKKTGATGEALDSMYQSVENVATAIPTDFATAGEAVGEVNTRFGLTGDSLDSLSSKFIKFADLNETNVSSSVDQTQQILSAFGLTADDAGDLLDTFNAVGQRTGVGMDALMGSMIQNSAVFKEMGFGAADTAYFLGELEMSGADTSQVMAGLKKALQNATKEGKPVSTAMQEIQDSIKGASTETEAMQIASELFGAKAGPAIAKGVREGRLSFDDFGASLTDAAGNIDTTFETTLDGVDKMTPSMNRLKKSSAELSDQVNSALAPHMERLAGVIERVANWFSNLDPRAQQIIVTVGLIAAAIGPLLLIFGTMSTAIGGLIGANGLGGLLTALSAVQAPILPIIAVIGALVAAFIYLWNTNEGFRNRVTEIWTEITQIFGEFFEGLKAKFEEWGFTIDTLKANWEAFCAFLAPIIIAVFDVIKGYIDFALNFILGLLSIFHGFFTGNWSEMWDGVKQILDGALGFLTGIFEAFCDLIGVDANEMKAALIAKFTELKEKAVAKFEELKEKAKEKFDDMVGAVGEKVGGFAEDVKEKFEDLKQGVSDKVDGVRQGIEDGFNQAVDFVTGLIGDAWGWGADLVGNIADGIWDSIGSVVDAVSSVADTIWSHLHFSEPDKGPLADFHTWMPDMMHGLADGMRKNMPTLEAAVDMVAGKMTGVVPGTGTARGYEGEGGGVRNLGGVSIVVNGAAGQDESRIADEVMARIMDLVALEG